MASPWFDLRAERNKKTISEILSFNSFEAFPISLRVPPSYRDVPNLACMRTETQLIHSAKSALTRKISVNSQRIVLVKVDQNPILSIRNLDNPVPTILTVTK